MSLWLLTLLGAGHRQLEMMLLSFDHRPLHVRFKCMRSSSKCWPLEVFLPCLFFSFELYTTIKLLFWHSIIRITWNVPLCGFKLRLCKIPIDPRLMRFCLNCQTCLCFSDAFVFFRTPTWMNECFALLFALVLLDVSLFLERSLERLWKSSLSFLKKGLLATLFSECFHRIINQLNLEEIPGLGCVFLGISSNCVETKCKTRLKWNWISKVRIWKGKKYPRTWSQAQRLHLLKIPILVLVKFGETEWIKTKHFLKWFREGLTGSTLRCNYWKGIVLVGEKARGA